MDIFADQSLTDKEVEARLLQYGENTLPKQATKSSFDYFIEQFTSPMIYILIIAGVISLLLKDYVDSIVIFIAVFINTTLGYYQEMKAGKALEALVNILHPQAVVVRNGEKKKINVSDIVPGDIVILTQGDKISADGELIEAVSFSLDESILTGESVAVTKKIKDEVFMGTTVVSGRGIMRVVTTGKNTKMGRIAGNLISQTDNKTPLQLKLAHLAKNIAYIVIIVASSVLVLGLLLGNSFTHMFTTSVALAVSAIPEGMVISLTVILAIGMQRILKKKALVRRLVAAETLGSVTVIATDKTGTLTEGKMRVSIDELSDQKEAVKSFIFANNLEDPLEIALWEWAQNQGVDPQKIAERAKREDEVPFDSVRRYMSVTIKGKKYVKGAPDVLLKMCRLSSDKRRRIEFLIDKKSSEGYRLIAAAGGTGSKLEWYGFLGLEDPVRSDIKEVFEQTLDAGIRIIMVTGDYASTAEAVWRKIHPRLKRDIEVVDGAELDKLSDRELQKRIQDIEICARVTPDQKLRIVDALKKNNEVVALLGDGVNDAPALKRADIGIVVNEASDVAKETADIVLLDSSFKTIITAIEEGRGIYLNIKKVILYLLSDSFAEILLVIFSLLLRIPLPLTASQILWINIVTDGFPSMALTVEPKEPGLLNRKPLDNKKPFVDISMKILIFIISTTTSIVGLAVFIYFYNKTDLDTARTVIFTMLGFATLLYIFSTRSLSRPIWAINQASNPYLILAVIGGFLLQISSVYVPFISHFMETVYLGASEWKIIIIAGLGILCIIEIAKYTFKKYYSFLMD